MALHISYCCAAENGAFIVKHRSLADSKSQAESSAFNEILSQVDRNIMMWFASHEKRLRAKAETPRIVEMVSEERAA